MALLSREIAAYDRMRGVLEADCFGKWVVWCATRRSWASTGTSSPPPRTRCGSSDAAPTSSAASARDRCACPRRPCTGRSDAGCGAAAGLAPLSPLPAVRFPARGRMMPRVNGHGGRIAVSAGGASARFPARDVRVRAWSGCGTFADGAARYTARCPVRSQPLPRHGAVSLLAGVRLGAFAGRGVVRWARATAPDLNSAVGGGKQAGRGPQTCSAAQPARAGLRGPRRNRPACSQRERRRGAA